MSVPLCQPCSRCHLHPRGAVPAPSSPARQLGAVGPRGQPVSPLSSGFVGGAATQALVLGGFFHVGRGCFGGVTGSGAVPWHPGEAGFTLAGICGWQHCRVRSPHCGARYWVTVARQRLPGDLVPQMLKISSGPACSSVKYFHCSSNSKRCREQSWCRTSCIGFDLLLTSPGLQ